MSVLTEIEFELNGGWRGFIIDMLAMMLRYFMMGFFFHLGWNLI